MHRPFFFFSFFVVVFYRSSNSRKEKKFISTGLNSFLIDWLAARSPRSSSRAGWTPLSSVFFFFSPSLYVDAYTHTHTHNQHMDHIRATRNQRIDAKEIEEVVYNIQERERERENRRGRTRRTTKEKRSIPSHSSQKNAQFSTPSIHFLVCRDIYV